MYMFLNYWASAKGWSLEHVWAKARVVERSSRAETITSIISLGRERKGVILSR
jgi:hypothetical protein